MVVRIMITPYAAHFIHSILLLDELHLSVSVGGQPSHLSFHTHWSFDDCSVSLLCYGVMDGHVVFF